MTLCVLALPVTPAACYNVLFTMLALIIPADSPALQLCCYLQPHLPYLEAIGT